MMPTFLLNPTTIHFCICYFQKNPFLSKGLQNFVTPAFYKQVTSHTIEEDNISIISCNGISYKRYLRVLEGTNKKIAVLTDNDKDELRISQAKKFNLENKNQHDFMGKTVDD